MTVRNIMLGLQCMLLASVLNSWSLFIWVFTENKQEPDIVQGTKNTAMGKEGEADQSLF